MTWLRGTRLFMRRRGVSGRLSQTQELLEAQSAGEPQLAVSPAGQGVVVYGGSARFVHPDGTVSPLVRLPPLPAHTFLQGQALAINDDGTTIWGVRYSRGYVNYARAAIRRSGHGFGRPRRVAVLGPDLFTGDLFDDDGIAATIDAAGRARLVFEGSRDGNSNPKTGTIRVAGYVP
jgi:hypothetical protein